MHESRGAILFMESEQSNVYIIRSNMMKAFLILMFLYSATLTAATELHVSAPKSLKGAMMEISELHEKNHPEWKVKLRTGKSSELGRMIAGGHKTDVFILTSDKIIKDLQQKKQVEQVRRILADDLVVIASAASQLIITEPAKLVFPELKGVALLGDKHPVGKASREYLTKVNVLSSILTKISPKKNAKEVVKGIVATEADWGIVYASDVVHTNGIKVIWKIPESESGPEIYYAGRVASSDHPQASRKFLETLNSTIARKIFENAGLRLIVAP